MTDDLQRIIHNCANIKIALRPDSTPVSPEHATPSEIDVEAKRVSSIKDPKALEEHVHQLLTFLCILSRDAQHLADWAIEADKSIKTFPFVLKTLTAPGVQLDRIHKIKPIGQDSQDI